MIYFMESENKKIELLDTILNLIPVEEIQRYRDEYVIVNKLKGEKLDTYGPIKKLIQEVMTLRSETMRLHDDIVTLKGNIQSIVRILSKPQFDSSSSNEFQSLKSNLGIY